MIHINLLPVRAAQKKERMISQLVVLGVVLTVVIAGCFLLQSLLGGKIDDQRAQISLAQDELNALNRKIGEVNKVKNMQKELQGKLDILAELKAKKTGPVRILDELSRAIPDNVWISSFREAGGQVSIAGQGTTEEVVAEFLRSLEDSDYFKGVELAVIEQQGGAQGQLQSFSLTCQTDMPAAQP